MTKYILGALVVLAIAGSYYVGFMYPQQVAQVAGSPVGSTFNTAKFAGIAVTPATAAATTTSILNPTGQDLYVTGMAFGCEGVGTSKTAYTGAGLASFTVTAATSSTAAPAINGNTNSVGGGALTIATSSAWSVQASTTATVTTAPSMADTWAAGSYMTFTFNATNTAACTVGVNYISS